MNIPAKFGLTQPSDFREEDWSLQTVSHDKSPHGPLDQLSYKDYTLN
jgi:hypothetical protein